MIKIAHETTLDTFDFVQQMTDYDYFLVHMFESQHNTRNYEYMSKFLKTRNSGRETILDNSIFELGTAYDSEKYIQWIKGLMPTYFIVPDVLNDANGTVQNFIEFMNKFGDQIPEESSVIGVCQGQTMEELLLCYDFMHDHCDKVALSYDSVAYDDNKDLTKYAVGRQTLVREIYRRYDLNARPLHLLGCGNPGLEGYILNFNPGHAIIDSIDTSAPVMLALNDMIIEDTFDDYENYVKPSTLMADIMANHKSDPTTNCKIAANITAFRAMYRNG